MRALVVVLAVALLVMAYLAAARPGTLLELTPSGALAPDDVDALTGPDFANDGQAAPRATHTVDTYLLRYESTWPNGDTAPITAQLFVPRRDGDADVFVFAPGSNGLVDACAPSLAFVVDGAHDTYARYALAYAGQGFVALVPNYTGFFDEGAIQPYFVREAEGRAVLDALRVVPEALGRASDAPPIGASFVGGYSQGGHAAFSAADLRATYAPDVPLDGVVGFGATTGLEALFREFTYVAPWVVHAYATYYPGRVDPADVLAEPYLSNLAADAESWCIQEVQQNYPHDPGTLYHPAFATSLLDRTLDATHPELAALFEENDAGLGDHGLPAVVLQGTDDPVVTLESQNAFVLALCERGSAVRYPNYLRTRHDTRYVGFDEAIAWMAARSAGEDAPSDCADVVP